MYIYNMALVIGSALLVVLMIINMVITLTSANTKNIVYIPAAIIAFAGIVMLMLATFMDVEMLGLGLGGWGGASLFASAITTIVTAVIESYKKPA